MSHRWTHPNRSKENAGIRIVIHPQPGGEKNAESQPDATEVEAQGEELVHAELC